MIRLIGILLGLFCFAATARAEAVAGYGGKLDEAKLNARAHALELLQERLAGHEPPLVAWRPTLADIDAMLDGPGAARASEAVAGVGVRHSWVLQVHFPSDGEMALRDRRVQRHYVAGLAALTAIVGSAVWSAVAGWRARRCGA